MPTDGTGGMSGSWRLPMSSECVRVEGLLRGMLEPRMEDMMQIMSSSSASDRQDRYARLLLEVLPKGTLRSVDGVPSMFDGRCLVPLGRGVLQSAVSNVLVSMGVRLGDVRKLYDVPMNALQRSAVRSDMRKVSFTNGVLDLDTGEFLEFSPNIAAVVSMGYAYDPTADAHQWRQFLEFALPDEGVRRSLQEFMGVALLDRTRMSVEKFALMVGKGSNGKSVVFDVITGVLGHRWVSSCTPDQLSDPKFLAELGFRFLNLGSDIAATSTFDSHLKAVFSGQTVDAWKIYEGMRPVRAPLCAFALNEIPLFRDTTPGFFRRLLVYRFPRTVDEAHQDRTLASRIVEQESSGVFNWLWEGCRRVSNASGRIYEPRVMEVDRESVRNRIMSTQHPVKAWMERNRLSAVPSEGGQKAVTYSATRMVEMCGNVPRQSVLRELNEIGVTCRKGDEQVFYFYSI